jgi:hypothetical protein
VPGYLSPYSDGLRAGRPGFDSLQCQIFLFSTASAPTLRLPIEWVPWALSPGINRPRSETDLSPPSSAKVKKVGAIPLLPINLHGIVLK